MTAEQDGDKPAASDDTDPKPADQVSSDDPQKIQKLAKAGDDIDPNEGQE